MKQSSNLVSTRIIGCGGYLPETILTNDALANIVSTSNEWIETRTGISQRHIAAQAEYSSHMAHKAALIAIENAAISRDAIDLVLVATTTPDNSFPGVANRLQGYLQLKTIPAFDIQAICSGFVYGLHIADSLIQSRKYKTILFVCAEKMTSLLDWQDRTTCILFGDGAGAVVLQQSESGTGLIDSSIYSDGLLYDLLYTSGGISSTGTSGTIKMKGQEVFKHAIEKMSSSLVQILDANGLGFNDVDHIIVHQANLRIINNIANKFNLPPEKVFVTVQKHANCSAASIPLALFELQQSKRLKHGDIIAFTAFGAGATWGAALMRW